MADSQIASLFMTPEMYQQAQDAQALERANAFAQLDPLQRAAQSMYYGGYQAGNAIAGALGGQDPMLQQLSAVQNVVKQIDPNDPNSLKNITIDTGILKFTADLSAFINPMYWNLIDHNIALITFTPDSISDSAAVNYLPNRYSKNFVGAPYFPTQFTLSNQLLNYGTWGMNANNYLMYNYTDVNQGNGIVEINIKLAKFPQFVNKFIQYLQAIYTSTIAPINDYQLKLIIDGTGSQFTVNNNTYYSDVVLIKKTDGVMNPVSKCYEILTMWIFNCNNNNITVSPVIESSNNITANNVQNVSYNGGEIDLANQFANNGIINTLRGVNSGDIIAKPITNLTENPYSQTMFSLPAGKIIKVSISGSIKFTSPLKNLCEPTHNRLGKSSTH